MAVASCSLCILLPCMEKRPGLWSLCAGQLRLSIGWGRNGRNSPGVWFFKQTFQWDCLLPFLSSALSDPDKRTLLESPILLPEAKVRKKCSFVTMWLWKNDLLLNVYMLLTLWRFQGCESSCNNGQLWVTEQNCRELLTLSLDQQHQITYSIRPDKALRLRVYFHLTSMAH